LTDGPRTIGAGLISVEDLAALDRLRPGEWLTFNYQLESAEADLLCATAGRLEGLTIDLKSFRVTLLAAPF
jgi:hypothetical protein